MTSKSATRRERQRRAVTAPRLQPEGPRRAWVRGTLLSAAVLVALGLVVGAMTRSSGSTSSTSTRPAPGFSLTNTAGRTVSLADYRGRAVVIYFSEGAGCGSCLQQMLAIEKDKAAFDQAGVTVLPIVMNTRNQITQDMKAYGVTTPFLLDDGTVSRKYQALGKGMHAELPGHSFVLVDKNGVERWSGEYPSMWLSPQDLLRQVQQHLA